MRASLTHRVGCSAPRLASDPFSFTHVRNQMTRRAVAAAAAGESLRGKATPLLRSPCRGCPWLDRSPNLFPGPPQALAGGSSRGEQQPIGRESPKRFLLRQRIPGGRKGHGAGAAPVSSPGSQARSAAAAVSSGSCPAFARCNPSLGINGGPAHRLPSAESLPPTRSTVDSYLFNSWGS